MNAKNESRLNMYRAVQTYCEANPAITNTVPAFEAATVPFKAKVAAIIATAQQEDLVTKGITVDKTKAKETLCRLAADIAAPIFAYAASIKNNALKEQVNFSYSDLFKSKDDILSPRCQNILDAGNANAVALATYGITPSTLSSLQAAVDTYQAKVPTPRNAAALKKTIGENLKTLFKETDEVLKEQMDKTITMFKATNPDFVRTYKNNRIIIDPSKKQTQLKGIITSAADDRFIKGAVISIAEKNITATTNASGEYLIKPAPPGTYKITITATGFANAEESNKLIKLGQENELDLALDPVQ